MALAWTSSLPWGPPAENASAALPRLRTPVRAEATVSEKQEKKRMGGKKDGRARVASQRGPARGQSRRVETGDPLGSRRGSREKAASGQKERRRAFGEDGWSQGRKSSGWGSASPSLCAETPRFPSEGRRQNPSGSQEEIEKELLD